MVLTPTNEKAWPAIWQAGLYFFNALKAFFHKQLKK
jgi:hypothetical protein